MTASEKKELLLKEWELMGGEKTAKGILKKLADKYQVPEGTVRRWKSEYLKKKKMSVRSNENIERTRLMNERDLNINRDIINGTPKEEIMSTYGLKKSAYYNKAKSIRELRIKLTAEYLRELANDVYKGKLKEILKSGEQAKANLLIKTINELKSDKINYKKITENEKAFNSISKMLNGVARNGDLLSPNQMNEIEAQLVEEEISLEQLEISRRKFGVVEDEEKIEIELKGV